MPDVRYESIFILSPPFFSHFNPLLALGVGLSATGAAVTVGCTADFREEIRTAGLAFREVVINRNSNRGDGTETVQEDAESERLSEFIEATKRGAVETLITQARHRSADMFANPEELIDRIFEINASEHPDLWIVDQLSYGATLALHGLGLPFITFCAPHPATIPETSRVYSVPPAWPAALAPAASELHRLEEVARSVDETFTAAFNVLLQRYFRKDPVRSAFGLCSGRGVVFNYPPFPGIPSGAEHRIYGGHSFVPQRLPDSWRTTIAEERPRVLIALGTFLASRDDVLRRIVNLLREYMPQAMLIVGAGLSAAVLADLAGDSVVVDTFIPQRALLPHVDFAVHHGGVSSFTETLYAGKPMLVMPFSSDQFNVAHDVQRMRLGAVLDPNNLSRETVESALQHIGSNTVTSSVEDWSARIQERGPDFVASQIQRNGGTYGST